MKLAGVITFGLLAVAMGSSSTSPLAYGQDSAQKEKALAAITKAADDFCQAVPIEQTSSGSELNAQGKAQLRGLASKIADLGVTGSAQASANQSTGVLQKDLAAAINDHNNCKINVLKILSPAFLGNTSTNTTLGQGKETATESANQTPPSPVVEISGTPCPSMLPSSCPKTSPEKLDGNWQSEQGRIFRLSPTDRSENGVRIYSSIENNTIDGQGALSGCDIHGYYHEKTSDKDDNGRVSLKLSEDGMTINACLEDLTAKTSQSLILHHIP